MPSTRQNPLRTNAKDREMDAKTGRCSRTIATGANDNMVKSQITRASATRPNGMPTANAANPLPDEAMATITRTTATRITTMPKTSSKVRPIRGSSRPRIRCHASPMVIVDPNTARPTTTVSMPLSMIAASISTMFPTNEDADERSSATRRFGLLTA